jgi:hypothetical protein
MRRPVVEAEVRLHLHDPPDPAFGHPGKGITDESSPEQGAGSGEGVRGKDVAREDAWDREILRPRRTARAVSGHPVP